MAIPTRIDISTGNSTTALFTGYGTNYLVETPLGVLYSFFVDSANSDPSFSKSLDGGSTWTEPTSLKACTCTQIAIWYDRWSGIDADLIHVVYTDSGVDDVFYRNINTASSDSLSTEYTIFSGTSTASGSVISISRMRGGNLIVVGTIDAGAEIFSKKSTNIGVNWSDIAAEYEANADLCIIMPGWGADNQDAMMFYYDRDATEISVKYYDDSANSWSETSIATSIVFPAAATTVGHFNAAVDLTNSQNLVVFWTAIDTANADLRCFKVTQSAQTETTTNVVLNSTDDQGFCGISIFGSIWNVFYGGFSDGTNTYSTNLSLIMKYSVDGGVSWSSEISMSNNKKTTITSLFSLPIQYTRERVLFYDSSQFQLVINIPLAIPRASYQLGI